MKLRLFALRNTATNKVVPNLFFPSKPAAKLARDQHNDNNPNGPFVVSPGPDHRRARVQ